MRLTQYNPSCCTVSPATFDKRFFNEFYHNFPTHQTFEFMPRIDISEDDKNFYIHAEVPGMSKEDVKISVNDERILSIKGEKTFEKKSDNHNQIRNERRYGSFSRSFKLPENVKSEDISASFKNGVLELTLPLQEPEKPKEYEVPIN